MDNELKLFANGIIQKTGIKFNVYDAQGKFVLGVLGKPESVPTDFAGVKNYESINKTDFK